MFRQLLPFLLAACTAPAFAQCTNNNVLTGTAVTPNCPGNTNIACVQGGQYALINVVAGNTYTFSTCGASFDTQITLFNNAGGGSLGFNDDACGLQSTVTWTATFTGQLRVLVDLYNCASNTTCAPLAITCTAPPTGDCVYTLTLFDSFSDGWGTSFVGYSINGGPFQNYTLPTGFASTSVQIGVNIGDVIVINYNASGTWQTDNSYILALNGASLFSSGSPPAAGTTYAGTVTCVAPPPPPEDCLGAVAICSNLALNNNTNNTGNVADINIANAGCLDITEFQGTWYMFSPSAGGNLGLTINPLGPDDYDWGVWGPYPPGTTPSMVCPPIGPPIRCAASSGPATFESTGSYATGMGHATYSPPQFAPTGTTYAIPSTFDNCPLIAPQRCGWVSGMQVTTGQVYLMYISNWSQSNTGFTLSWNLQNGASLDCTILPVDLLHFDATGEQDHVAIAWTTAGDNPSASFDVERSQDGNTFEHVGTLAANQYASVAQDYLLHDEAPLQGMSYYRLVQVDGSGNKKYSQVRSVVMNDGTKPLRLFPNPGKDVVDVQIASHLVDGTLEVIDATGRTLLRRASMKEQLRLEVPTLAPGSYTFRLVAPDGRMVHEKWMREQ